MRILFLSRWYPYPPTNGSKLRIFNLLQYLVGYHDISLLSFAEPEEVSSGLEQPAAGPQNIRIVKRKPWNPNSKQSRIGFLNPTPRSFLDTFSPELVVNINQIIRSEKIEFVIASQVDMAAYSNYFQKLPALYEEAEVGVLYEQYKNASTIAQKFRNGLTWKKHKRFLSSIFINFMATTVVSTREAQLMSKSISNHPPIHVIPNGVDINSYHDINETRKPFTMIFPGAFSYNPNYEAMEWFIKWSLPFIQDKIPEAQLKITGNHLDLPLPNGNNIIRTGFVKDVRPLIAQSECCVVPIFTGGGTRLKILEAIALRTPVVTTSKGVEGLNLIPEKDILIADSPKDFSQAVIRVLTNPETRNNLSHNALNKVKENYDWSKILPNFLDLIQLGN